MQTETVPLLFSKKDYKVFKTERYVMILYTGDLYMTPYYLLLLLPAVAGIISKKVKIKYSKTANGYSVITIFFLIFLLMLCLRDESVGIDLPSYHSVFDGCAGYSFSNLLHNGNKYDVETGYALLSKAISLFSTDFRWMIICVSILSIVPIWLLYKHNFELPYLTVILFLGLVPFSMFFSGLRQAIAMAFIAPAFFLQRKKN